jgi:tetratricopeptide (TPR) repeat protein
VTLHHAKELRAAGKHEQAREMLVALASQSPSDALIHYEAACVHDFLGFEAQAVPFYIKALEGELPEPLRRSAYTGLGSTYRTLGMYQQAEEVLVQGLAEFPEANEIQVFLAMARHNLGQSKSAVESLLRLVASTSADPQIKSYARAIEFYAQDIGRSWPSGAA